VTLGAPMASLSLVAVAVGACSLLDYGSLESAGPADSADAGSGPDRAAVATPDAGGGSDEPTMDAAGGRCDLAKPFGRPVELGGVNGENTNEVAGRLTPNELTMYFARDDGTGNEWKVFVATRPSITSPFSSGTAVAELDTSTVNRDAFLLRDGVTLYFASDREGGLAVFSAVRQDSGSPFGAAQMVTLVNTPLVGGPYMLPDDVTLYFADEYDSRLYWSTWNGTAFPVPALIDLGGLQGQAPVVTADGATLFFSNTGVYPPELWTADRSADGGFAAAVPVTEVMVTGLSYFAPSWISDDACDLYFDAADQSSQNIYMASRGK
jgi:hypothetical protein